MNGDRESNPCLAAITFRSDLSVSPSQTFTSSVSFSRRFINCPHCENLFGYRISTSLISPSKNSDKRSARLGDGTCLPRSILERCDALIPNSPETNCNDKPCLFLHSFNLLIQNNRYLSDAQNIPRIFISSNICL